ncbi:MAG: PKD domain-containing protein, partial [Candidatus Thermoplasmatota archaeon]|nr:PKD domain-containing protein [Candidatus Thermoplasmatota archaeon]
DSDGDILSFFWMEDGTELGAGTPFTTQDLSVGTHTITLMVTDGTASTEQMFEIIVEASEGSDDEGIPFAILIILILGIAVGLLTLFMFLRGRMASPEPPEGP